MLQRRIQSILSLKPHHLRENSRTAGLLLGVCLCCVLPLFAVTCATRPYAPGAEEPLYGTWVNEEYATLGLVRSDTADVKYVFAAAGKFYMYASTSDPAPKFEGRLAFDDKWIDKQGNVYYKAVQTWRYYPYDEAKTCPQCPPCYVLYRVNAAGDMLESVSNQLGYPEEFSHVAGWYMVHYRPRGR